jgi:hypothetical protein
MPCCDSTVFDAEPFGPELTAEGLSPKGARRSLIAENFIVKGDSAIA